MEDINLKTMFMTPVNLKPKRRREKKSGKKNSGMGFNTIPFSLHDEWQQSSTTRVEVKEKHISWCLYNCPVPQMVSPEKGRVVSGNL